MPGQRGILGYKKDPKNLMLFTYTGEDWPSDDSWDSDYEPDDSDDGNKQKKSRWLVHWLINHGLVMPYGDIDLGQHWLR